MTVFDIFMVILGLVLVAVSFFFVEKVSSKDEKNQSSTSNNEFDEERILTIQNTVEENIKKISEAVIVNTENSLNKVTNEKIMAITDYSDQILEKIDQNHTEVVFLYNMLNEKDEALKQSYNKPNKNAIANQDYEHLLDEDEKNKTTNKNKKNLNQKNNSSKKFNSKAPTRDIHGINNEEAALLTNSIGYSSSDVDEEEHFDNQNTDNEITDKHNNNDEIIKLYEAGKSITEIAKALDLGKGEVTFVVNLFKKK